MRLYNNVFKPNESYIFPSTPGKDGCKCSVKYLHSFSWLAYSPSLDGLFCLPCTLFGHQFPSKNSHVTLLFTSPLRDWSTGKRRLQQHEGSYKSQTQSAFDGLHKYTMDALTKMLSDFSGKTLPIEILIDKQRNSIIQQNREKLKAVVETVIFLGRNGLPFRGHRDDLKFLPEVGNYGEGRLVFLQNV